MSDHLDWNEQAAISYVLQRAVGFLNLAAMVVTRRARQLVSIAGTAATRSGKRKGKRRYGAVTSKPGEPPRKQTGHGRTSISMEVDPSSLTARVGTNLMYMKALELGTKRGLQPRPWLRRALNESQHEINQLLAQADDSEN